MKTKVPHSSVSEMVRSLSDRPFAKEFEERQSKRQLIKALMVLRSRAGLSQQELAERLGCSQSKISKLESSDDADIEFGDLMQYTGAVGCEMRMFLVPQGQKLVDEVKMYAFVIKRLLDRLVQLVGDDGALNVAVGGFIKEAAFNLTRMAAQAAAALPPMPKEPPVPLQVESPEIEAEQAPPARTAKVTRESRKTPVLSGS